MHMYRLECSDCDHVGEQSADRGAVEMEMLGHACYIAATEDPEDPEFDPQSLLTPERRRELFPTAVEAGIPLEADREHKKQPTVLGCKRLDFGGEVGTMVYCTCGMSHTFMTAFAASVVFDKHSAMCDGRPGAHKERLAAIKADEARLAKGREASSGVA